MQQIGLIQRRGFIGDTLPIKRAVDIAVTLCLMPVIVPLLTVLAAMIWLYDGANPFFAQDRVGRNGRMFRLWKLRSMGQGAEHRLADMLRADNALNDQWEQCYKITHDPRITPLGRTLRRYSLDELPQFWNILLGEMTLVGPRPVTAHEYARHYRTHSAGVFAALTPGLTGLWQVSGRNNLRYCERVALDMKYHNERGFRMDANILLKTIGTVLRGSGC